MYVKVTEKDGKRIVAACDRELVGKVFEEGGAVLDLDAHSPFYVGGLSDASALEAELGEFDSANLVGKKAVGVAVDMGIVQKNSVKYIKGVPHLQIYRT
jgi:hypothetical protein